MPAFNLALSLSCGALKIRPDNDTTLTALTLTNTMIPKPSGIFAIVILAVASCASAPGQTKPTLDTTTFVAMGEGLAAGMANYGLSSVVQQYSFPAQMAAQMSTAFEQPLIQPPGIGDVIGYPRQEVKLQTYPQGSVRQYYQPDPTKQSGPPL